MLKNAENHSTELRRCAGNWLTANSLSYVQRTLSAPAKSCHVPGPLPDSQITPLSVHVAVRSLRTAASLCQHRPLALTPMQLLLKCCKAAGGALRLQHQVH